MRTLVVDPLGSFQTLHYSHSRTFFSIKTLELSTFFIRLRHSLSLTKQRNSVLSSFTPISTRHFSFFHSEIQEVTGRYRVMDSNVFDSLLTVPETIEKFMFPSSRPNDSSENKGVSSIPADILETAKEYVFYLDVPGLSKSDIQVTVEGENTLVIKSGGKRKREDGEDEGCKYVRLERKIPVKMMRKFRLPENANPSAITAKCENGVLTLFVEKNPPLPKSKTVEVTVS